MSDRPVLPVLTEPVPDSCYTLRVDLRPEEIEALGFILRYVETSWNVDETLPDGFVRRALCDARHVYSQCVIGMAERLRS